MYRAALIIPPPPRTIYGYAQSACDHCTSQCGQIATVEILFGKDYAKYAIFGPKMASEAIYEHLI